MEVNKSKNKYREGLPSQSTHQFKPTISLIGLVMKFGLKINVLVLFRWPIYLGCNGWSIWGVVNIRSSPNEHFTIFLFSSDFLVVTTGNV